ncbi:sugar phosphate nucleotidyltransferase [Paenibacillus senegalensis]|uniref:sugar phosphate nucleotidyltransferase n=1 Tax=Paenibacillus senegalensis TaxID=1465766 RepID=UPI0002889652|nr:sugar phosphate nucleotidyltransferase [Paenibacillus senegalensis]
MKGVILAGGNGTRLAPLTTIMNKHLLPVGKYPMIHYGIEKFRQAGIDDILLITGKAAAGDFINYLGSGRQWNIRLTYRIQEEASGIANALELAEPFILPGEKFIVLLGDNLFADDLSGYLEQFLNQTEKAMVLLKQVSDPERYGVPSFKDGRIEHIYEKPEQPPSSYCVTGIYGYDSDVFKRVRQIAPSRRGELEISDVNNLYAKDGELAYQILQGWWTDAGTFPSLLEASQYWMKNSL